jgi:Protein chain release factor B
MALRISHQVLIPDNEIEISSIRAQGRGDEKVNKVSSAIHLRFDSQSSSLPAFYKLHLLKCDDHRITKGGVVIIKAQEFRSREKNKAAALERLQQLIIRVAITHRVRKPTKPTRASVIKRMNSKLRHGRLKRLRKPGSLHD